MILLYTIVRIFFSARWEQNVPFIVCITYTYLVVLDVLTDRAHPVRRAHLCYLTYQEHLQTILRVKPVYICRLFAIKLLTKLRKHATVSRIDISENQVVKYNTEQ